MRQCEFGRAALERALGNVVPKVYYMGIMRPDMKSVVQDLEQQVYKHWDGSRESGPKQRPRSEQEQPSLPILRWADGVPKLPEQVLSSFPAESSQHAEIVKMEAALNNLWPAPAAVPRAESAQGPVRTPAVPDFTDSTVLDVNREISLAHVAAAGFQVDRPGKYQAKHLKIVRFKWRISRWVKIFNIFKIRERVLDGALKACILPREARQTKHPHLKGL